MRIRHCRLILTTAAGSLATLAMPSVGQIASQPEATDTKAEQTEEVLVRAIALAERAGITPGGTVWVGIRFDIEDGWHTYWPGQNDTGLGTEITPSGPDTASFGPVVWPAPHRYTAPGEILDHVHEGTVAALIPVTASSEAAVGSTLDLSFDLAWLVCDSVCIPGWETVTLRLPVVAEELAADAEVAAVFAKARARVPLSTPDDGSVLTLDWDQGRDDAGRTVQLRAPGAAKMAFYPDTDGSRVQGLLRDGMRDADSLRLRFDEQRPTLSGVVEIFSGDTESRVFRVRSTPGAP